MVARSRRFGGALLDFSGLLHPLLFFFCCYFGFREVVITIIYFVGVYGKGFPVDSSLCIYLSFLFRLFSRSLISYFAWLVCGWFQTRGTWVDGIFPGAVWLVIGGFFMP